MRATRIGLGSFLLSELVEFVADGFEVGILGFARSAAPALLGTELVEAALPEEEWLSGGLGNALLRSTLAIVDALLRLLALAASAGIARPSASCEGVVAGVEVEECESLE